jgi:glyoxylase-like metal-dependent hydrolase (beta-lactamase superfamily II)
MGAYEHDGWFSQEKAFPSVTRIWEPHVHRFFRANIWLVEGRDADLVVGFGMGILPLAPALRRNKGKPLNAVATHAHVDHVGSFHEFPERSGHWLEAEGFASMDDAVTLADMFREIADPLTKRPHDAWRQASFGSRKAPLTHHLDEGHEFDLGEYHFEVLHLPGHSPGSIGLWEPNREMLFSGDAIYSGTLVDDVPGASIEDYRHTMTRLASLEADIVFPGHNGPISGEEMRSIASRYLRERQL